MAKRTHRATACKLRPGAFTGTDRQRRFPRPVNPLCLYIPFQHIGKRDAIDVSIDRSPHATPESAGLASLRVVAFPLVIDACNRHARAFRCTQHIADADLQANEYNPVGSLYRYDPATKTAEKWEDNAVAIL